MNRKHIITGIVLSFLVGLLSGCSERHTNPVVITPIPTITLTPVVNDTFVPVATETSVPTYTPEPTATCTPTDTPPTPTPTIHVHEWIETESVESTCIEAGHVSYLCGCGETKTKELPLAEHIPEEPERTEPTVESEGSVIVKCAVCGEVLSEEILAKATPTPTDAPKPDNKGIYHSGDYDYYMSFMNNNKVIIGKYKGRTGKEFTIPDTIDGLKVEGVSGAFENNTEIEKLTIPSSIEFVSGFQGCINLKEVNIENGVKDLQGAFIDCLSLESVVIPPSVKSLNHAFEGCTKLKNVQLSEGLESLHGAFDGCTKLDNINIPQTVRYIDYAFWNCSSLTNITINNGVETLAGTFIGCSKLKKVVLPDSLKVIGMSAFENCTSLEEVIIPKGVTSIGWGAFENCSSIENIVIPDSVTEICDEAFKGCINLKTVSIYDEKITFGKDTFANCPNLETAIKNGEYYEKQKKEKRDAVFKSLVNDAPDTVEEFIALLEQKYGGGPTEEGHYIIETRYSDSNYWYDFPVWERTLYFRVEDIKNAQINWYYRNEEMTELVGKTLGWFGLQ